MDTVNVRPEKKQQEKHIELDLAIECLDDVLNRAQNLFRRISGEDGPPEAESRDKTRPSLISVLSGGSDQIRDKCTQINGVLDQLDDCLF